MVRIHDYEVYSTMSPGTVIEFLKAEDQVEFYDSLIEWDIVDWAP